MRTLVINELVAAAGLDTERVKVLRHQETDEETGRTSWDLWREDRAEFELHQSLYDRTVPIGDSAHIVSLLAPSSDKTVFAGVWEVVKRIDCPSKVIDPLIKRTRSHQYDLREHGLLPDYCGRMVVDWPSGRTWHRRLSNVTIRVLEIHEEGWDVQPFPGFTDFTIIVSEAAKIPATWREVLRSVRGVYLLVDVEDGRQYVGSASGNNGFFERLERYAQDGHGGNVKLRRRRGRDYQFTVLEVVGTYADQQAILSREKHWKKRLGSRAHGLNLN